MFSAYTYLFPREKSWFNTHEKLQEWGNLLKNMNFSEMRSIRERELLSGNDFHKTMMLSDNDISHKNFAYE